MTQRLLFAFALLLPQLAYAQQDSTEVEAAAELSEVTVTAGRISRQGYNPTVAYDQVEQLFPMQFDEVLANNSQVFVQRSQQGGGSPMIRGFAANSILLKVDGVRMNNAIFRSGNLHNVLNFDPLTLEQGQIFEGPHSARLGSDALGGGILLATRRPDFLPTHAEQASDSTHARVELMGLSTLYSAQLSAAVTLRSERWWSFFQGSKRRMGDVPAGQWRPWGPEQFGSRPLYVERIGNQDSLVVNSRENVQRHSGFDSFGFFSKTAFRTAPRSGVLYDAPPPESYYWASLAYNELGTQPRYDRLQELDDQGNLRFARWDYGPQRWLSASLGRTVTDRKHVVVNAQAYRESRLDRRRNSDRLRERVENVRLGNVLWEQQWRFLPEGHWLGAEASYNRVESSGVQTDITTGVAEAITPRYPGGGSETGLAEVFYRGRVAGPLSAMARVGYYSLTATFDDLPAGLDLDPVAQVAGAAWAAQLDYAPSSAFVESIVLSSGYRFPNVDDVGKFFERAAGTLTVPNPEVAPEYAYGLSVNLTTPADKPLRLLLSPYATYLRNALVLRPTTLGGQAQITFDGETVALESLQNTREALIAGAKLTLLWNPTNRSRMQATSHYIWGEESSTGLALRHVPPPFGSVEYVYTTQFLGWGLRWRSWTDWQLGRDFAELAPEEQAKVFSYSEDGALGWFTLNSQLNLENKGPWRLFLSLENLMDMHYRPYASGISAPGRMVRLGFELVL